MEKAGELGNGLYLIGVVSRLCITDWDNAGRRCISFAELPKLDVAGSTPVARSNHFELATYEIGPVCYRYPIRLRRTKPIVDGSAPHGFAPELILRSSLIPHLACDAHHQR
jgi:hypothetical protein